MKNGATYKYGDTLTSHRLSRCRKVGRGDTRSPALLPSGAILSMTVIGSARDLLRGVDHLLPGVGGGLALFDRLQGRAGRVLLDLAVAGALVLRLLDLLGLLGEQLADLRAAEVRVGLAQQGRVGQRLDLAGEVALR